MKIKIFSFMPLAKEGQFGFNVVIQPEAPLIGSDETYALGQILIVGMRVMYGKIYPPAQRRGDRFIPSAFFDPTTAEGVFDAVAALENAPPLMPLEEAISGLVITDVVAKQYAKNPV